MVGRSEGEGDSHAARTLSSPVRATAPHLRLLEPNITGSEAAQESEEEEVAVYCQA